MVFRVVRRVVRKRGGQIDPAKLVLRGVRRVVRRVVRRGGVQIDPQKVERSVVRSVVRRVVRRGGFRLTFKKLCSEGCAGWCAGGGGQNHPLKICAWRGAQGGARGGGQIDHSKVAR